MIESHNTLSDILAERAPTLAGLGAAMAACLLLIAWAFSTGRPAYGLLALALLLVLTYLDVAILLIARRKQLEPDHAFLFSLGAIERTEHIALLDLGRRTAAIALARRLTTGRLHVINLYNPQLTPGGDLVRARRRQPTAPPDPRLIWRDGQIDLLPLPDASVSAVFLIDTLSQYREAGDRERLLREAWRILQPGGRLLLSERTRTLSNRLALSPGFGELYEAEYWGELLKTAGFEPRDEVLRHDLTTCWRAVKPATSAEYQLAFGFLERPDLVPPLRPPERPRARR